MRLYVSQKHSQSGLDLTVDPSAMVRSLSVGLKQRVEILKALAVDARILILDEPTAVLSPQEVDGFFTILRKLQADGQRNHLHQP